MTPVVAVRVEPDIEHIESGGADVYVAEKPAPLPDPSLVKDTFMYPVEDCSTPGKVGPLKGLPDSSVALEHEDDVHENTRTRSQQASVLKLVKVRVTVLPGADMMT
jgi:hypothetical protein